MASILGKTGAGAIRAVAGLVDIIHIADTYSWWSAAWRLGKNPGDGAKVLAHTWAREGPETARNLCREMLNEVPDAQLAGYMASMEYGMRGSARSAAEWTSHARQIGCDNLQMLLWLELELSNILPDYEPSRAELVEEALSRNDLPGLFSRSALLAKAELYMEDRQWQPAEQIADRILKIEEHSGAFWVKWITATVRGEQSQSQKYFSKMASGLAEAAVLCLESLGYLYIGDHDGVMTAMHRAEQAGVVFERVNWRLAEIAQSSDYQRFQEAP